MRLHNEKYYKGKSVSVLPTPCLLINLNQLKENIRFMQARADLKHVQLRPHIKTHKCPEIAKMQIEQGAVGVCCTTLGEAISMAVSGLKNILITNQIVSEYKLHIIADLLDSANISFLVDSIYGIEVAQKVAKERGCVFKLLIEINSGLNRCGVRTPSEARNLAMKISRASNLKLTGLQAYNGATSYIQDVDERAKACAATTKRILAFTEVLHPLFGSMFVTGAGSRNMDMMAYGGAINEVQCGSYVFSDTCYYKLLPECAPAITVLSTVISSQEGEYIVLDVGSKRIGHDFGLPEVKHYQGKIKIEVLSEEHATAKIVGPQFGSTIPTTGEKVEVIPSHCCETSNLYRHFYVIDDNKIIDVWNITAFDTWI